jgi:AbrB family looped-hinge helix DNA binding protein
MANSGFSETPQAKYDAAGADLQSVPHTRLKIDQAGRIVIPAEMRAAMMVKPGDTVTAKVVNGEFTIVSPRVAIRRFQAIGREWQARNPGVDPVAELIADRRAEARREADEWRKARGLPPLE